MPKPASVPTWNTDATNRTTPTGGQIATGIEVGEAASSSRMNYLLNLIGQWLTWLDAGVLTGVSFVASGVLTAGGLLTGLAGLSITGAAAISGAVTAASATLSGALASATAAISGNATVGGTLGVTGTLTGAAASFTTLASSGLSTLNSLLVSTTATITGALTTAAITASGLITASLGLTAATGQHVTVIGSGRFKHGSFTRTIHAFKGEAMGGSPTVTNSNWLAGGGSDEVGVPLDMQVGERITTIFVGVLDFAGSNISAKLFRHDMDDNSTTQIGSTGNSSSTGQQYISISGLTETVAANLSYYVKVEFAQAGDRLSGVVVTYDFP